MKYLILINIFICILINFIFLFNNWYRIVSFYFFILFFLILLGCFVFFNKTIFWFQLIYEFYRFYNINVALVFGVDFLSMVLVLLCSFLLLFCFLSFWNLKYKIKFYVFLLFLSLFLLINVFLSLDLFYFFIFFEAIVIPMFFLICIWGSRVRKIYAAYQLFIYTLLGSIFVLICVLDLLLNKGSTSFEFFLNSFFFEKREFLFWLFLFLGFSVKIPIMPFHVWLPEAHVEAPTVGSVILAGILLKLGSYAMFRFLITFVCYDLIFFVLIIALYGFIYASLLALNQIDIKKLIAYSSIAHMNFSLIGLFSQSISGLVGCIVMMLGHALTSSALFLGIGVLYDRYKTRLIFYYSSIVTFMPIFSLFYFIFILSNFGFPGTFNFVGELLITLGGFSFSRTIILLSTFGMILSLFYSLFLYNRIFFGAINNTFIRYYTDITRLEFYILIIFFFFILYFGIFPNIIFSFSNMLVHKYIF